jgi:transcriptional regulator with XRE-family HTH domain
MKSTEKKRRRNAASKGGSRSSFGESLKTLRRKLGLTQAEFAARVAYRPGEQVARETIAALENGRLKKPTSGQLIGIGLLAGYPGVLDYFEQAGITRTKIRDICSRLAAEAHAPTQSTELVRVPVLGATRRASIPTETGETVPLPASLFVNALSPAVVAITNATSKNEVFKTGDLVLLDRSDVGEEEGLQGDLIAAHYSPKTITRLSRKKFKNAEEYSKYKKSLAWQREYDALHIGVHVGWLRAVKVVGVHHTFLVKFPELTPEQEMSLLYAYSPELWKADKPEDFYQKITEGLGLGFGPTGAIRSNWTVLGRVVGWIRGRDSRGSSETQKSK